MSNEAQPAAGADGAPQKQVVLLVEDDFWTRYTAAESLRAMGFRIIEAQDAAEALSVLSSGTAVDAVFSDINMPGSLDGVGLAHWIAERLPRLPVLLTSAAPAPGRPTGSARAFLAKPYDLFEVERVLRALIVP